MKGWSDILVSAVLGLMVFLLFIDPSILNPAAIDWIPGGDMFHDYLGGLAFNRYGKFFPVLHTPFLNHPEGVSLAFSTNLLMALFAKMAQPILPEDFQLLGIWLLICLILQAFFSMRLVRAFTDNKWIILLVVLMLCLFPFQIKKLGQPALFSVWVLIAALSIYFSSVSDDKKRKHFFILTLVTACLHSYLLIMVILLASPFFAEKLWKLWKQKEWKAMGVDSMIIAAFGIFLYIFIRYLGYGYGLPDRSGIQMDGTGSVNLNFLVNPVRAGMSALLGAMPTLQGQGPAGSYLGLGWIVLLVTFTVVLGHVLFKQEKKSLLFVSLPVLAFVLVFLVLGVSGFNILILSFLILLPTILLVYYIRQKEFGSILLLFPALFCFVFALENQIAIGDQLLFSWQFNDAGIYHHLQQMLRSAGRMIWVFDLVLIALFLKAYLNNGNQSLQLGILGFCLLVQIADLSELTVFRQPDSIPHIMEENREVPVKIPIKELFTPKPNAHKLAELPDKFLTGLSSFVLMEPQPAIEQMIAAANKLHFVDFYQLSMVRWAILNNVPVNKYNPGQGLSPKVEANIVQTNKELKRKEADENTLYVLHDLQDLHKDYDLHFQFVDVHQVAAFLKKPPGLESATRSLSSFTCDYRRILNKIRSGNTVIFSSKGIARNWLNASLKNELINNFDSKLNPLESPNAYAAIFRGAKLEKEEISGSLAEFNWKFENYGAKVKSKKDKSSIKLKGVEFSFNKAGLNVLVIDDAGNMQRCHCSLIK